MGKRSLGALAHRVLLKETCSALTPIEGNSFKVTGPMIFKSRPVAAFTEELNKPANCVGLTKETAYKAPSTDMQKKSARPMKINLNGLRMYGEFYKKRRFR